MDRSEYIKKYCMGGDKARCRKCGEIVLGSRNWVLYAEETTGEGKRRLAKSSDITPVCRSCAFKYKLTNGWIARIEDV